MNKKNELIIGFFTLSLVIVLYWGINFLKGENVFSNKQFYYAVYENVDGLTISRPVTINGFKVGQVSAIEFSSNNANLVVQVSIEEQIPFSRNSILEIYDSDIMGSKSLELKLNKGSVLAKSGDTLIGSIANGITSEVSEQFGSVKVSLDQLIISFDDVLKEIKNLSSTANRLLSANELKLSSSLENIESISNTIENQTSSINKIILNLKSVSDSLSEIRYISISENINNTTVELEKIINKINNNEGTVSKLVNQDSLHLQLTKVLNTADKLLLDFKANPKKYVSVSVFGNNKKTN